MSVVQRKESNQRHYKKAPGFAVSSHRFCEPIIFNTKLTMALAGWSGSSSAKRWLTLSVVLPCLRATNPNSLEGQKGRDWSATALNCVWTGILINTQHTLSISIYRSADLDLFKVSKVFGVFRCVLLIDGVNILQWFSDFRRSRFNSIHDFIFLQYSQLCHIENWVLMCQGQQIIGFISWQLSFFGQIFAFSFKNKATWQQAWYIRHILFWNVPH